MSNIIQFPGNNKKPKPVPTPSRGSLMRKYEEKPTVQESNTIILDAIFYWGLIAMVFCLSMFIGYLVTSKLL